MAKGMALVVVLLLALVGAPAPAQTLIPAADLELGAFGWQPRGGAKIEAKQLRLDLPAERSGSADAWLGIPLQGDFSIDVDYVIEARGATVVSSSVGAVLDPGDNSPGITVDRARRGGNETITAGRGPDEKSIEIKTPAAQPSGSFRLVRRADSVEIFARDEQHAEWTSIKTINGRIPPQVSLGLTAQKAGRGEFRALIKRVAYSSNAGGAEQPRPPGDRTLPVTKQPGITLSGPVRIGAAGGAVSADGCKVEFPKGSVRADTEVALTPVPAPPAPRNKNLRLVPGFFSLSSKQTEFASPALVTLRYDPAALPGGMKPEDLVPVVGRGGNYEELKALSIDPAKREITFNLRRLHPRVGYQDGASQDGGMPAFGFAGYIERLGVLYAGPDLELRGPGNLPDAAATIAAVRETVRRTKTELESKGFARVPPPIKIGLVPVDWINAAGYASGDDLLYVDQALVGTGDTFSGVIAHEYFHLVQNVSRSGYSSDANVMPNVNWITEATAEWVGQWLYPMGHLPLDRVADIRPEFFHAPFFHGTLGSIQHYKGFVFFSHLDRELGALNVIKEFYPGPRTSNDESPTLDPIAKLESILTAKGKRLPDEFTDFLIHYDWKKDREPMRSVLGDEKLQRYGVLLREHLGVAGELKHDSNQLIRAAIPFDDGGKRQLLRRFETVAAEPYGLAKTYDIASKTSGNEKGDLKLTTIGPKGQARIVAFPYGAAGISDPVVGEPGAAAVIRDWPKQRGAIVWLLSVTNEQRNNLALEARLSDPDAASGRWVLMAGYPKVMMPPGGTLPPSMKVTPQSVVSEVKGVVGQIGEEPRPVTYQGSLAIKGPPAVLSPGQSVKVSLTASGDYHANISAQWLVSAVGEKQGVDYVALSPAGTPNAQPTSGELTFVPTLRVLAGQPYVIELALPQAGNNVSIRWAYEPE